MGFPILKKLLIAALAIVVTAASAQQKPGSFGFMANSAGNGAQFGGFVGPGDVIPGAVAWWGFQAYSKNTAGTKAARLVRASDSTQTDISTLANGNFDVTSASTFCLSTLCRVVTLYDQTGAFNCGGASCDLTNATTANQPVFVFNCIGSQPCMSYSGAQTSCLATAAALTAPTNLPYTISLIAERTGNFSNFSALIASASTGYTSFNNAPGGAFAINANGTGFVAPAAGDNLFHSFIGVFTTFANNGASSDIMTDGSVANASAAVGSTGLNFALFLGCENTSFPLNGLVFDAGIWAFALTPQQQTALNSNQKVGF